MIDGNIGVGKSSIINELHARKENYLENLRSSLFVEPVEEFKKCKLRSKEFNVLECLYNKTAEAAIVQDYFLQVARKYYKRAYQQAVVENSNVIITERSIVSAIPFIDAYGKCGTMSEFSCSYLTHRTKELMSKSGISPDLVIVLDLPVFATLERILSRSRKGEQEIDAFFLKALNEAQFDFYKYYFNSGEVKFLKIHPTWSVEMVTKAVAECINTFVDEHDQKSS